MNLLVTGLNLPFESPPQSITQLSSALAAFDRGCAMVKISGFGEVLVLVLNCKRLLFLSYFNDIQVVLELSVDLERRLTWPGTHDFGQHEAIIEATCRFK